MLSKLKYVMSKSWVNSQMETCFWGLARFSRFTWRDMLIGTKSWLHGRVMIFQIFHVSGPWHGSSLGTNRHCPSRGTAEDGSLRPLFFLWSYALSTQALTVWVHRLLLFSLSAGASLPPRYWKSTTPLLEAQQEESTSLLSTSRMFLLTPLILPLMMGGCKAQSLPNGNHELPPEMLGGKNWSWEHPRRMNCLRWAELTKGTSTLTEWRVEGSLIVQGAGPFRKSLASNTMLLKIY